MKIYEVIQGTPEWHQFRQKHIGASESGIILGFNPWRNVVQLWEEKTLGWEQPMNEAMARGQKLEHLARESYEKECGIKMEPLVAEHDSISYISASFDGINVGKLRAVEIKCGKSSHKLAQRGEIPPYYFCQLQHQMLVADLEEIDYYSFDGKDGILINQKRDDGFINDMLEKYKVFWHNVLAFKIPEVDYDSVAFI